MGEEIINHPKKRVEGSRLLLLGKQSRKSETTTWKFSAEKADVAGVPGRKRETLARFFPIATTTISRAWWQHNFSHLSEIIYFRFSQSLSLSSMFENFENFRVSPLPPPHRERSLKFEKFFPSLSTTPKWFAAEREKSESDWFSNPSSSGGSEKKGRKWIFLICEENKRKREKVSIFTRGVRVNFLNWKTFFLIEIRLVPPLPWMDSSWTM